MTTNLQIWEVDGISVEQLHGVVLPENPIGDKLLAYWLLLRFLGQEFLDRVQVEFWGGGPEGNRPSEAREEEWRKRGFYQLDVGSNRYHDRDVGNPRAGSACEMVLRHLGVIEAAGPGVAGLFRASHEWLLDSDKARKLAHSGKIRPRRGGEVKVLVELRECCERNGTTELLPFLEFAIMASLNNATGIMKRGGKFSLFYMVREMIKSGVEAREMIAVALTVIGVFYEARTQAFVVREPEEAADVSELRPYLVPGGPLYFGKYRDYFTAGQLLEDLWTCGWSVEDCLAWATRWTLEIDRIAAAEQVCAIAWQSGTCKQLIFGDGLGVLVHTEDPRMARWILRQASRGKDEGQVGALANVRCVVVMSKQTGNVAILSRGLDMRAVGDELVSREQDRWFFDHRIHAVLNGGHMDKQTAATQLAWEEILRVVYRQAIQPFFAEQERRRGGGRGPGGGERNLPEQRDDGRAQLRSAFDEAAQRGGGRRDTAPAR